MKTKTRNTIGKILFWIGLIILNATSWKYTSRFVNDPSYYLTDGLILIFANFGLIFGAFLRRIR